MKRSSMRIAIALVCAGALAGCGGDVAKMMTSNPEMQVRVMDVIGENGDLAGQMTDRLLAADSTRALLLDKVLGNGAAVQEVMSRMAKDPTMVEGILNLAVQDTSMRERVVTLLRGMQMVGGARR
jgi:hypothetical protein